MITHKLCPSWGFEAEAERCAKRTRQLMKRKESRTSTEACDCSSEDYSTDEEYQKIIAGEDSDEDEDEQALKMFLQADADGSGSLSLKEYMEISRQNVSQNSADGSVLAARLTILENKVDDIAKKVDRLCDALAPPRARKRDY